MILMVLVYPGSKLLHRIRWQVLETRLNTKTVLVLENTDLSLFCSFLNEKRRMWSGLCSHQWSFCTIYVGCCFFADCNQTCFKCLFLLFFCLSVCFRPPRDLDSKACVTIGEKVIWFLFPGCASFLILLTNGPVFPEPHWRFGKGTVRLKERPCGESGMPFIAPRAIKLLMILNSSNKRNFPLGDLSDISPPGLQSDVFPSLSSCKTRLWGSCGCLDSDKRSASELFVLLLCAEQKCEVKADDLEQICELGRGAYGVVDKMRHVPSGLIMAVKVSQLMKRITQESLSRMQSAHFVF